MKTLYWKLAWHGIYKNQKIYLPFLLTSIGITMMYYIVSYLTYSKAIYEMHGGQEMQMILSWGTGVVAIFAAIFLFYMNSFLMRRRKPGRTSFRWCFAIKAAAKLRRLRRTWEIPGFLSVSGASSIRRNSRWT